MVQGKSSRTAQPDDRLEVSTVRFPRVELSLRDLFRFVLESLDGRDLVFFLFAGLLASLLGTVTQLIFGTVIPMGSLVGENGKIVLVINCFSGMSSEELVRLEGKFGHLDVTKEHPVLTSWGLSRGDMICNGDEFFTIDSYVCSTTVSRIPENVMVYNLDTSDNDSFYAHGILTAGMGIQSELNRI